MPQRAWNIMVTEEKSLEEGELAKMFKIKSEM